MIEIELRVSVAVPLLVTVTVFAALVEFTAWLPKATPVLGLGLKVMAGWVPVPVRPSVCGLLLALSLTLMVALRAPVAVGLKVTLMVQLALAASAELVVQVPPLTMLKSDEFVPVME